MTDAEPQSTLVHGFAVPGELVARLEAASVGSRELDCLIGLAIRTDGKGEIVQMGDNLVIQDAGGSYAPQRYTTSLDAALALAERIRWRVRSMDASIEGRFSWCLQSLDPRPGVDEETGAIMSGIDFRYGSGKTPALALCIAVLKVTPASSEGTTEADSSKVGG